MTTTQQPYPLQVRPGATASQRRAELDGARFVDVRNLANLVYKKADGTPLLTFQDTLGPRQQTFEAIIQYEIAAGLIANDGGQPTAQAVSPLPPQPTPTVQSNGQNGANYMTQPMMPPPPGMPLQNGAPSFAPPPPPGMPGPAPTYASPAQAAAVPAGVPMQQPEPPTPSGRKRRGAGSAVAPPPGPPPPIPQPAAVPQTFAPPGFAQPPPGQQMAPMQTYQAPNQMAAAPAPTFNTPAPQQTFAPQVTLATPAPSAAVMPGAATINLDPILQRLDSLGKGLEVAANGTEALKAEMVTVKGMLLELLAATHHIYGMHQPLAQNMQGIATLDDFRKKYLPQFINSQN